MKTGQTAPAFQFYASDVIADRRYRLMSLEERGLLISLLCECWVNQSVPADPELLGKCLGYPEAVIKSSLSGRVKAFFKEGDGELISPELEAYRQDLLGQRKKMSEGGKRGAQLKEARRQTASALEGYPQGEAQGPRVERSRDEPSRGESSRRQESSIDDEWVRNYDNAQNKSL